MAKYVYPAVFTKEDGGYFVNFPDVKSCYTDGVSLVDAIEKAKDVLAMVLCIMEKEKATLPSATPISEIQTGTESFATLILCDTTDYPIVDCE